MVGSFSFCLVAPVVAMALGDGVCRRCRGDSVTYGVWAEKVEDGVAAMASGQTDSTSQAAPRPRNAAAGGA